MYDDMDWSGEWLDFDGGGAQISQYPDSMYFDDDFYEGELYPTNGVGDSAVHEMASGEDADGMTYYERISVSDLFDQCVVPTLSQAFFSITTVCGLCVVCRMSCLFCHTGLCGTIFLHVWVVDC